MRTELRVEGANCPVCLDSALDALREVDGINSVSASIRGGCVAVEHDGVDADDMTSILHRALRGVSLSGTEIVMSRVDPAVVALHCHH